MGRQPGPQTPRNWSNLNDTREKDRPPKSQAFSVTLYAFGLAESVRFIWPSLPVVPAAFVIVLGIGVLASRGSAIALKVQLPLLLLVGVSLAALIGGAAANPLPNPPPFAQSTGEVEY